MRYNISARLKSILEKFQFFPITEQIAMNVCKYYIASVINKNISCRDVSDAKKYFFLLKNNRILAELDNKSLFD